MHFISCVCYFLLITIKLAKTNDVLGCGGFIKSHVQIDFSKIEVELYTKQGILKDKTNCAPNNGYYFIPLYDKGDYVLQLQPPPGWSFNPTKVNLAVDGIIDVCSQGQDINFIFKGFGITGRVESFGENKTGPKGIDIELKSNTNIRKTVTSRDGSFFFTPVYPGNYVVSISHKKWKLLKHLVSVQVEEGNTELPPGSLVVAGYDVTGYVKSDGEPIEGVALKLYQLPNQNKEAHVLGCEKGKLPDSVHEIKNKKSSHLCYVLSSIDGSFTFPTVSPGKYLLVPYKGQNIHFQPDSIEFEVNHDSVILPKIFEIIGFSVYGRVLDSKDGNPLENGKVFLNGNEISVTKADGLYSLNKIKADAYHLHVIADNVLFEETVVKINPNLLELPNLYPSQYKVCGVVLSEKSQVITITRVGTVDVVTVQSSSPDGKFCRFVIPGKYQFHVSVSNAEKGQGIQFFPISHTIEVISAPILSGITFSQLKSVVSGQVQCIREKDCEAIKIVLRPIINDVPVENKDVILGLTGNSTYMFKDIRPGNYEIFPAPNKLCWKSDKHSVAVSSTAETAPLFAQSGYSVIFVSSHNSEALYRLQGHELKKHSLQILKGRTAYCVDKPGSYEFVLESCHTYENNVLNLDTDSEINEVYLTAQKHTATVAIAVTQNFGDLYVIVNLGGVKKQEGPLMFKNNRYMLGLLLAPGESAILIPQSDILYFNPPILSISGSDDCTDLGVKFTAMKGKVFRGKIIPPLAGVLITIESENSDALMDETGLDGKYKFPPQDDSKPYKISAKKDTYILVGPNENGDFLAHKLAEVTVEVVDEIDDTPLQGALLSLSGGESYRSNLQTNESGKIIFRSLSPSEYFLRPMMKEYSFQPSSKIIDVKEGASVNIKLKGRKVAYSCFGQVTSLNGEPEEKITVVGEGLNNCTHFSEEVASEANGQFRIRGLQPYCSYGIKIKGGPDEKRPIERAVPSSIVTSVMKEDISNLKFIIFRPTPNMDILVRVFTSSPDTYKTIKIKLVQESPPSSVIHTVKLDNSNYKIMADNNAGVLVQIPSVPLDNKSYSIQIESSISQNRIKSHTQYFVANSSFKYVDMEYLTKATATEQNIKQTSLWTLLLIFGSLIGVYNIDKTAQLFRDQFSKVNLGSAANLLNHFKSKSTTNEYVIDKNEIDQIVQSINAPKRKIKPRKT